MATRGRWPRLVIEFLDGQTREFQFDSDNYSAGWEPTLTDLIIHENDTTRHVFPRCNIWCFTVHSMADPELPALNKAINGAIGVDPKDVLDWSDAVNELRATARRGDFDS